MQGKKKQRNIFVLFPLFSNINFFWSYIFIQLAFYLDVKEAIRTKLEKILSEISKVAIIKFLQLFFLIFTSEKIQYIQLDNLLYNYAYMYTCTLLYNN